MANLAADRRSNTLGHERETRLRSFAARVIFTSLETRKEGRTMTMFFRHYRQRGPVNALQMRLQG